MSLRMTRCPDLPISRSPASSRSLRVLYIAYPLLTVSDASAGGAEQVLWTLEREMAARGIRTAVAASAGSRVTGELFATGACSARNDDFERRNLEHQDRIIDLLRGSKFDLVHDMSGSFWTRAADVTVPVLATLHLPRHFYAASSFQNVPENVRFHCVSQSQAHAFADLPGLLGVVQNGIPLDRFLRNDAPREGLLWLGRICEEKGPHLALDIAARAQMPIVLAGQVYPFSYHQQFFEREIAPRLRSNPKASFVNSPSPEMKLDLLQLASAVLITSLVDETSSLVAMEAAASGAPVVAFRRGALPEVVQHGRTGFLVDDVEQAVHALDRVAEISPRDCVQFAHENFSAKKMADRYAEIYADIVSRPRSTPVCHADQSASVPQGRR